MLVKDLFARSAFTSSEFVRQDFPLPFPCLLNVTEFMFGKSKRSNRFPLILAKLPFHQHKPILLAVVWAQACAVARDGSTLRAF